ncbi:MBOAT-domain-containing protein [Cantharellus anzutake]|uniref:MBOAT-domain-containing protein n=1 Tax=Cantharellus anzutake TaxID=1750568 RepID=UPI001903F259|nr:MBOAT-domain-containing protein [Cantharellus anzutake]KAF8339791.1 MBOAT-domain-containing protein [Cantharellus anzutake]
MHVPSSINYSPAALMKTKPSRWRTPEFAFYGVAFLVVVPFIFKSAIELSQTSHPNYIMYQDRLSNGWLFGRKVDNSDMQYRSFRNNFMSLLFLSSVHLISSKLYTKCVHAGPSPYSQNSTRAPFLLITSISLIFILHGASALKILGILILNYLLTKSSAGQRYGVYVAWSFNIFILFANKHYDGYRFESLHASLAFLDAFRGVYPRWSISFNVTILRLISFGLDFNWASRAMNTELNQQNSKSFTSDDRHRISDPHPLEMYNLVNYVSYTLYPPLYIAGPIMTFNDFVWQLREPVQISRRTRVGYALRFLVSLLTMEFVLHFMYVVAIKDAKAWTGDTPFQLAMIGYWNLVIIWLKLLIPWRFFRLWSLLDGFDPPENMIRCVSNNYSTLGFWRSWHRSYNLWLIRYIYIPLGGGDKRSFGIIPKLIVFTFVALWHDLSTQLLAWSWLVVLFIIPEVSCTRLFPESKYDGRSWYRHVCAVGGALNIIMMMLANLVGFVLGADGVRYLVNQLLHEWEGAKFLLVALPCLFIAVQVMFEYRESEKRKGIFRKC